MRLNRAPLWLAMLVSLPAVADTPEAADIQRLLQAMQERITRLEASNAELSRRLDATTIAEEKEHAITHRLEDMEVELLSLRKQAREIEKVSGVSAGADLTLVAQRANTGGLAPGAHASEMNYRADVSVVLPGGSIGDAEGHLFGHFRLGQGDGLALRPTLTATPNSTAFRLTNPDDSTALLAQAWYQLDVPLGGSLDEAPSRVEFNVGKMDPFVFFDQNGIADDESSRFLNNVFVHNPLLDSGGDAGVDRYGFTPGMRLAYQDDHASPDWWRVSLGVFGSGPGASFDDSFVKPFVIAQVERAAQWLPGRDGTYRLYAWSNGRAGHYDGIREERHSGWGLSLEQQVSDATTLFARYGDSTRGHVRFDRALTLGGELSGAAWGREHDRLGLALGWLRSSAGYRADDPDGYGPDGSERLAELYYTWQANERFELSPDVQWIGHPGGRGGAGNITLFGLRAKLSY